jgi:hypothetical protein
LETIATDIARDLADGKMKKPVRGPKTVVEKVTNFALSIDKGSNNLLKPFTRH